jgi:serine/threonine-protein kinase PBS1
MVSCFISCLRRAHPDDGDPCTSPSAQNSPLLHTTRKFTLAQLSAATGGFHSSNLVGEGGFGRVYRGRLDHVGEVAVKKLRRGGAQGSREFMVECTMLMLLHHPNVVSLVGYCAQAQERLLVYEFFPRGSLDAHLFPAAAGGQGQEPNKLGWDARVKVAVGTARGLR